MIMMVRFSIKYYHAKQNKDDKHMKNSVLRLTEEELAFAMEVSRQTISSLEKGRYNPSIILAFKLARYFDMSIEEIFIYEEDSHEEN